MKKNQSVFSPVRTNPEVSRRLKLPDFKTIGKKGGKFPGTFC
jgi:hypothetical protein